MKRSSKYNLLAKNESKKEKDQQEWVQMESVNKWQGKPCNNEASYVKFQEQQYSQIDRDNVPLNKGNEKSTYLAYQKKDTKLSSINQKRMSYLQSESLQQGYYSKLSENQKVTKPQITSQKIPTLKQQQQQYSSIKPQPTRPSQSFMNPVQNQYNNYPPNPRQSTFYQYGVNYGPYQHQSMYMPNNVYQQSQLNNYGQSQISYNQSYYPQQYPNQSYQSSIPFQPNTQPSTFQSSTRPSTRKGIPQMTVNCQKCTFTQSVPGNSQMYICCMCNQINQCFPLYGVFTCGICRANVIYPHGTSRLIKCTKCQTVNRVNPQPSKRVDQVVTLGKERVQLQEEYVERIEPIKQNPKIKMTRNQYLQEQYQKKITSNKSQQQPINLANKQFTKNFQQQPFKILPSKNQPINQQIDFFDQKNQPQITQDKQLRRQFTQPKNIQFKQELIDLVSVKQNNQKSSSQHKKQLHEQLLQLNEKLDESLVVSKQVQKQISCHEMMIKKQSQVQNHQIHHKGPMQYPSIFDD